LFAEDKKMKMKRMIFILLLLAAGMFAYPRGGHWEIGGHYSYWSIDVVSGLIEDELVPKFQYYDPEKGKLNFKSDGNNYGIDLRFFPGGKNGSFSIGLSYEVNNFKAKINGSYTDSDGHGNQLAAEVRGNMDLRPNSLNINFRWELFPAGRIHPYIGIGVGAGRLNGTLTAHSKQTVYYQGQTTIQETDETKTLKEAIAELEEDGNNYPFNFFPIVQVQFGLRAEIVSNVYLLAEGAVYDGIVIRGGLSYRF
jgi:opacity protein-like surface antigen